MKLFHLSSVAAAALCLSCTTSDVMITPIGRDTYMATKTGSGFAAGKGINGKLLKTDVLKEANDFCAKQGRTMILLQEDSQNGVGGREYASAEIKFRAVSPDDSENQRRNYVEPTEHKIIEVRER